MTIIMCPSSDDYHGEFPHRLVIPFTTIRQRDENGTLKSITITGPEYVVCAHCDHWIERAVITCKCRHQCHQQAYIMRALDRRERAKKRYRSVTSGAA